jgi:hypothetical protein
VALKGATVNELLGHDGKTDQARYKRVLRGYAEVLSNLYWWIELSVLISRNSAKP